MIAVALALRLYGIDWDGGRLFHPDERAILMKLGQIGLPLPPDLGLLLDPDRSPLNPRWFPYGSLPLYLIKLGGHLVALVRGSLDWADYRIVGRIISAVFDVGTVLLIFALGRRFYGAVVGWLGAVLLSLTVLHIQLSHFSTVDTAATFFVALAAYAAVRLAASLAAPTAAVLGVAVGLALACKVSAFPVVLLIPTAAALACFDGDDLSMEAWDSRRWSSAMAAAVLSFMFAAIAFCVAEPYAILDAPRFLADTVEQSNMVRRISDLPYTRQYIATMPYLYQIWQSSIWGFGLPLGVAAWGGLVHTVVVTVRRWRKSDLLLLTWVIPYFVIVSGFEVKFPRYLLMITPFLCLMGARLLVALAQSGRWRRFGWPLVGLVVAATAIYAVAFLGTYSAPHPANVAAQWIKANVPAGSVLAREHWEEAVPGAQTYPEVVIGAYEPDTPQKTQIFAQQLARADYIVFFSNRLYATISRLPERYPMTSRYYRLLFSGELGFELRAAFASYPNIGGVALYDDTFARPDLPRPAGLDAFLPSVRLDLGFADESLTVYDHPLVMVFGKTEKLSEAELLRRLSGPPPPTAPQTGLMLAPDEEAAQQAGGTWRDLFDRDGLANRFPLLVWLLTIEGIAVAALPIAFALFHRLPDRGYLFAKTFGIVVVVYLSWVAPSLKLAPFDRTTIAVAWAVLAVGSVGVAWWRRRTLADDLRQHWRTFAIEEAVFLAAFFAFYGLRLLNPDLWHPYRGGEKPMDFAYLNAVIKSSTFPPYDPWFAGGYLNYYYYGQAIVATLIKLAGIVPSVAYNLAVPTLFALTFGGVFGVVFNLVADGNGRRWAYGAGLVGAVFVGVLGNLDGAVQVAQGLWRACGCGIDANAPGLADMPATFVGLANVVTGQASLPAFDFWRSSRMMPPQISITEFPYFTFLFADLHAHLIALPFTVLAIGLSLALVAEGCANLRPNRWVALVAALGLTLGTLWAANTWDFATYLGVGSLAVVAAAYRSEAPLRHRLLLMLSSVGLLATLSYLLYSPFHAHYELFYRGVALSRETTPLHQYLAIHGLFLFVVVTGLWWQLRRSFRVSNVVAVALVAPALTPASHPRPTQPPSNIVIAVALAALVGAGFAVPVYGTVVFVGGLWLATLALWLRAVHTRDEVALIFALTLLLLAFGIGIGVDLFTVNGDIARMNTVFKFYLAAWVLLGIAAAYFAVAIVRGLLPTLPRWLSGAWLGGLVVLAAAAAIYPLAATPVRLADRFTQLPPDGDGAAFMSFATYRDENGPIDLEWDYLAIRWLQDNVAGSPVIVEGQTPQYRWGARIAVHTGLPTLIGYDWEQRQQRLAYGGMIDERLRDVRTIYTTTDWGRALALLRQYRVSYVYLGRLERLYYPGVGLTKFDAQLGRDLELAYTNDEVKIYRLAPTEASR